MPDNKNNDATVIYEDDNHYLNIDKQIGKGSFAKVYKGYYNTVDSQSTNDKIKQLVAIKVIDSSLLSNSNKKQQLILTNNLEVEITILKKLVHNNIVRLITTMVVNETKQFIIVMEYCNLGDLSMLIRVNKNHNNYNNTSSMFNSYKQLLSSFPKNKYNGLNHVLIYSFIKQLASALKFIRSKNLIHRDIKPQNLLLSTASSNEIPPILKIADFGFARFLPAQSMAETLCGSPQWMAPEILSYKKYDEKVDLWSSGAVIYEMCFGKPAYSARNYMELLKKIKTVPLSFPDHNNDYQNNDRDHSEDEYSDSSDEDDGGSNRKSSLDTYELLSKDMRNLIQRLLTYDPEKRMTFKEFFRDPIVTINLETLDQPRPTNEIQYHDVFYDDSDEEEEKENSMKRSHKQSYKETDGYLMIDNDAIQTASEYPINERRKSSASSRRSSFAGMTRAITKAFRSASQTSTASSSSAPLRNKNNPSNNQDNSHTAKSKKMWLKLPEQPNLAYSQFFDLTTTFPQKLEEENLSASELDKNKLEREQAKLHILQKILKQEDSPEWRLQIEIRLLDHISKLMNLSNEIKKDEYMVASFNTLVVAAEVDYAKTKADKEASSINNDSDAVVPNSVSIASFDEDVDKQKDILWPNETIVDLLWQHVSKFGRISIQLERAGQVGAACMGYASILWLLDYILFDLESGVLAEDRKKFLRMVTLTVGRLKGIY